MDTWGEKIHLLSECYNSAAFLKTLMWSGKAPQRRWHSRRTPKHGETWVAGKGRRRCQRLQKCLILKWRVKCVWGVVVKCWRGSTFLESRFSGEGMPGKTRNSNDPRRALGRKREAGCRRRRCTVSGPSVYILGFLSRIFP